MADANPPPKPAGSGKKKRVFGRLKNAAGRVAGLLPFAGGVFGSNAPVPVAVPPPPSLLQEIPSDQTQDVVANQDSIYELVSRRLADYQCVTPPPSLNTIVHGALAHWYYALSADRYYLIHQLISVHLSEYGIYLHPMGKSQREGDPENFLSILARWIQEATENIYYQLTIGFSTGMSMSIFIHATPEATEVMLYFNNSIYVVPLSEFYDFLRSLMLNEAYEEVLLDRYLY